MGRVALAFRLQKELQEPNLLTPTGKKSELGLGRAASAGRQRRARRPGDW